MAKDDYNVIVCKVLIYLYSCLKRINTFDERIFKSTAQRNISEDYFTDILRMMQEDGLINGLVFTKVWGGEYIMLSDLQHSPPKITSSGINYLSDNDKMKSAREFLTSVSPALFGELIKLTL